MYTSRPSSSCSKGIKLRDAADVSIGRCLHSGAACSATCSSPVQRSAAAGNAAGKSWRARTAGQKRKGRKEGQEAHLARQLDGLGSALHLLKLHVGKAAGAACVAVIRDAHLRVNTGGLEACGVREELVA